MDIQPAAILAMVDRIVESTTDDEVKTSVQGMRIELNGILPSVLLQKLVISGVDVIDADPLQSNVDALAQKVSALAAENAQLEAEVAELRNKLQQADPVLKVPSNGCYTMEYFLANLCAKLRRSYGWRTDYICASNETESCTPVTNEMVQKWQNADSVPDWAVDQIARMVFRKRTGSSGPSWSNTDEVFLANLYRDDPTQKNVALAKRCEEEFGRVINENSIKGALDRLRKKGHLPLKRPNRLVPKHP